jgi:hypothetical protein
MSSFFSKVAHVFGNIFSKAPSVLQTARSVIGFVGPLVTGILPLVGGEEYAAETGKIIAEIESDLATAGTLISQAHGAPSTDALTTISNSLVAANNNLGALLSAGHIKDPATVAKVTAVVNTVTGELQAVVGLLAKPAA